MKIRLSLVLVLALSGLARPAMAADAAAASPYLQQRNQAYTSFDNPYSPGAIYNPYGSSPKAKGSMQSGSASLSAKAQGSRSSALDALHDKSSPCPGSLNGSRAGAYSSSTIGSLSRGRTHSTGTYSSINRCGGDAGGRNAGLAGGAAGRQSDGYNRPNGPSNGLGMSNTLGRSPQTQLRKRLQKTQQ